MNGSRESVGSDVKPANLEEAIININDRIFEGVEIEDLLFFGVCDCHFSRVSAGWKEED